MGKVKFGFWIQKHFKLALRVVAITTLGSLVLAGLLLLFSHPWIALPFALLGIVLVTTLLAVLEILSQNLAPAQEILDQIDPKLIQNMLNLVSQMTKE